MRPELTMTLTIVTSVLASSGLWAFLDRRADRRDARTQLLLGIAHNQIMALGTAYLSRGYVTIDEYEDLLKYLYSPYSSFGGNGMAEKVMKEVQELPIHFPETRKHHRPEDKHV